MTRDEARRFDAAGQLIPGLAIDCIEVVELVTDYLEGVLDEVTTAEVEAHLALCDPCRIYLDQMRATIKVLGHVPVATLTDEAKSDLLVAFRDIPRPDTARG